MKNLPTKTTPRRGLRLSCDMALVAAAALILSGCTHTIVTPCISKDQALPEAPPKVHDQLTGEADKDTRVLAGGLIRWQSYAGGLRQILEQCQER